MIEMLRKINLSRALRTMQELFPEEYNFYPRSWILPEEYQQFSAQVSMRWQLNLEANRNQNGAIQPDTSAFLLIVCHCDFHFSCDAAQWFSMLQNPVRACACACVRARACACVCVCLCARVRAYVRVCPCLLCNQRFISECVKCTSRA